MKNCYPLPFISKLLDQLGRANIFSKIDLTAGYNQVCIAKRISKNGIQNQVWGIQKHCHELWHVKCPFNLIDPHKFRFDH